MLKWSLLVTAYCFLCAHVQSLSCNDAYECANSEVIAPGEEDIFCHGYFSCSNAAVISIADPVDPNSIYISCGGSFSCYQAVFLNASQIEVGCEGLYSCAMIENINLNGSDLFCHGELSCFGSTITRLYASADGSISCTGDRSCANSTFTLGGGTSVTIYGHLAAQNSIFQTFGGGAGGSIEISFFGRDSGDNVTIICGLGDDCTINCYGNGCNNVNATCISAGGCNLEKSCNSAAELSSLCLDAFSLNSIEGMEDYTLPSLAQWYRDDSIYEYSSDWDNSVVDCNKTIGGTATGVINCNGYQECTDMYLSTTSAFPGPICCSARSGCENAGNITSEIETGLFLTAVRCDGYLSCAGLSSHTGVILGGGGFGGNIYFSGYRSLDTTSVVKTTRSYDVFCTGETGCRYGKFRLVGNVYCMASWSCRYSDIENVNYVWSYGYYSLDYVEIRNVTSNVYCGSYYSCTSSKMSHIGKNVYGYGFRALYSAQMNDIGVNVLGFGTEALSEATINVTENVCGMMLI